MVVEKHPQDEKGVKTTDGIPGGLQTSEIFNLDQMWCIIQRTFLRKGSYSPSSSILDFLVTFNIFD